MEWTINIHYLSIGTVSSINLYIDEPVVSHRYFMDIVRNSSNYNIDSMTIAGRSYDDPLMFWSLSDVILPECTCYCT